jgi:hypothetical protein
MRGCAWYVDATMWREQDQTLARIDQQALRLEETLMSVQEAVATAAVVERLKQVSEPYIDGHYQGDMR